MSIKVVDVLFHLTGRKTRVTPAVEPAEARRVHGEYVKWLEAGGSGSRSLAFTGYHVNNGKGSPEQFVVDAAAVQEMEVGQEEVEIKVSAGAKPGSKKKPASRKV